MYRYIKSLFGGLGGLVGGSFFFVLFLGGGVGFGGGVWGGGGGGLLDSLLFFSSRQSPRAPESMRSPSLDSSRILYFLPLRVCVSYEFRQHDLEMRPPCLTFLSVRTLFEFLPCSPILHDFESVLCRFLSS